MNEHRSCLWSCVRGHAGADHVTETLTSLGSDFVTLRGYGASKSAHQQMSPIGTAFQLQGANG